MMRYNDAGTINAIVERVVVQVYLDCLGILSLSNGGEKHA